MAPLGDHQHTDEGLVGEYDASGNEIRTYGYKPGGTWSTDPLFVKEDTNADGLADYYFYLNDHLGTPQKLVEINGGVVWLAVYDAFGQASVEVETVSNNLRFPGQYFDDETGLHYNWNRYYDPGVGRYLTPDPIGFWGGVNFYTYASQNPLSFIDVMGLAPQYQPTYSPGTYYPAVPPTDPETLEGIICIMNILKMPIIITEGLRTDANHELLKEMGLRPAEGSQHRKGRAVDIKAYGNPDFQNKLLCAGAKCGFKWGKKYCKSSGGQVHLDMGPEGRGHNQLSNSCGCN